MVPVATLSAPLALALSLVAESTVAPPAALLNVSVRVSSASSSTSPPVVTTTVAVVMLGPVSEKLRVPVAAV